MAVKRVNVRPSLTLWSDCAMSLSIRHTQSAIDDVQLFTEFSPIFTVSQPAKPFDSMLYSQKTQCQVILRSYITNELAPTRPARDFHTRFSSLSSSLSSGTGTLQYCMHTNEWNLNHIAIVQPQPHVNGRGHLFPRIICCHLRRITFKPDNSEPAKLSMRMVIISSQMPISNVLIHFSYKINNTQVKF